MPRVLQETRDAFGRLSRLELDGVPVEIVSCDYTDDEFGEMARAFDEEADLAADFIYKSPGLIRLHEAIEIRKLFSYFPDDGAARQFRWQHEASKLYGMFPFFQATGNLFCIVALLELYVLRLALRVEQLTDERIAAIRGRSGLGRSLKFLRQCGVDPQHAMADQVEAAIDIRNCLAHTSGYLALYSGRERLIERVQSLSYLSSVDREKPHLVKPNRPDDVVLMSTEAGDRLEVRNSYPFILCGYFREFFGCLCIRTSDRFDANGSATP